MAQPMKKIPQVNWRSRRLPRNWSQSQLDMTRVLTSINKLTMMRISEIIAIKGAAEMNGPLSRSQEMPPMPAKTKKIAMTGFMQILIAEIGSDHKASRSGPTASRMRAG